MTIAQCCILLILLCTTRPLMVLAFTKCEKVDACKYKTDEGELSLWSLAASAEYAPRFRGIKNVESHNSTGFLYYWNPCISWTPKDFAKSCSNIAAYMYAKICINLGTQESAKFHLDSSGNCVLSYSGSILTAKTHFAVTLKCDESTGGKVDPVTSNFEKREFSTTLHSKYACIHGGPSTGSILVIIFVCVVAVYLAGGILFNRFSKGATGKELLPNYSFWEDFPSLVKDGMEFTGNSAKHLCCKGSSYESI